MIKELKISVIFLLVVIFQIIWHWLLTWQNSISENALRIYLLHNPHSLKGVSGYVDTLPAILIGLLLGGIGWQWSFVKRLGFILVFTAILVLLGFVYVQILGLDRAWWWPKDNANLAPFLFRQTVTTLLPLAVCVYGGRRWRIDRQEAH